MHVRVVTVRTRRLGAALLFPALLLAASCSDVTGNSADAAPDSPAWEAALRLVREDFPGVPQMTTARLAELLEQEPPSVLLLDARRLEEYEVGHLRAAVHADGLDAALAARGAHGREGTVVVYCSVGYRSAELAERLIATGVDNVFNLEGSLFRWANEDRPVHRGAERVFAVHPYDDDWASLLDRRYWPP